MSGVSLSAVWGRRGYVRCVTVCSMGLSGLCQVCHCLQYGAVRAMSGVSQYGAVTGVSLYGAVQVSKQNFNWFCHASGMKHL